MAVDMTALWNEETSEDDFLDTYQHLVNTGQAWRLEGHVGRTAMALIESGELALGPEAVTDYYGNKVPGRDDVEAGTKGSVEYVLARGGQVRE